MVNYLNMEIILIKHAETEWNRAGIYQGWLDSPLTSVGKIQAMELAKLLKNKVDIIISSDLGRAIETAKILSMSSGISMGYESSCFRERNFGFLEGKCKLEIMKTTPEWFRDGKLIDDADVPDIESFETFRLRLLDGLEYLKEIRNKKIAIVTHGAAIKMLYT
ncbi:hypothetical protein A2300_02625, partial [Candidatus Falkowbacteria bacterium RIFOXYB2_FULL_35_7]